MPTAPSLAGSTAVYRSHPPTEVAPSASPTLILLQADHVGQRALRLILVPTERPVQYKRHALAERPYAVQLAVHDTVAETVIAEDGGRLVLEDAVTFVARILARFGHSVNGAGTETHERFHVHGHYAFIEVARGGVGKVGGFENVHLKGVAFGEELSKWIV